MRIKQRWHLFVMLVLCLMEPFRKPYEEWAGYVREFKKALEERDG